MYLLRLRSPLVQNISNTYTLTPTDTDRLTSEQLGGNTLTGLA